MIDPQEPKDGDFASYVEKLVNTPARGGALQPSPGAVQTAGERRAARRAAEQQRSAADGVPTSGPHAAMPELLRKVLASRGGTETRQAMEGLFRAARTPGTGASGVPVELAAGAAAGVGRVLGRIGGLLLLAGIVPIGLWIAGVGIFDEFPEGALPLLFFGFALRAMGSRLRGTNKVT